MAPAAPVEQVVTRPPQSAQMMTPIRDVPIEDSGRFEESLPPMDAPSTDDEAMQVSQSANVFSFPDTSVATQPVAEIGKSAFPGEKEFQEAVGNLPPGLTEKLRDTLGAEFTSLRPVPAGKLRRPL